MIYRYVMFQIDGEDVDYNDESILDKIMYSEYFYISISFENEINQFWKKGTDWCKQSSTMDTHAVDWKETYDFMKKSIMELRAGVEWCSNESGIWRP